MKPTTITVVAELLLRTPGTVIDQRAVARALSGIGLDTRADIVGVRVILGSLEELVKASVATKRSPVRRIERASVLGVQSGAMLAAEP